ncbi:methyltransferase domain-containing protein [Dactylosporangium darangshiense]
MSAGRRVSVDGHPICAACGAAVAPTGPDRWRHLPPGRPYPHRSKWLAPVTLAELRRLDTFEAFAARYPELAATPDDWREGRRRLEAYHGRLSALKPGRPDGNPLLDLMSILAGGRAGPGPLPIPQGLARVLDLPGRRREVASRLAWSVPTEAALGLIGDHGPILDAGAGTGYWAALLRTRGVDVVATDAAPPDDGDNAFHRPGATWAPVERLASVAAVRRHRDRTLLLCWPPPENDDAGYAALRAYRGERLLYVGGGADGPTGTVRLHRELDLNWTPTDDLLLPSWPGIPDRLTVWRRNPSRRPHRQRDRCTECRRFVPTGAIGRCDDCYAAAPPALALRSGGHRVEYPAAALDAMPAALRAALEASPNRL